MQQNNSQYSLLSTSQDQKQQCLLRCPSCWRPFRSWSHRLIPILNHRSYGRSSIWYCSSHDSPNLPTAPYDFAQPMKYPRPPSSFCYNLVCFHSTVGPRNFRLVCRRFRWLLLPFVLGFRWSCCPNLLMKVAIGFFVLIYFHDRVLLGCLPCMCWSHLLLRTRLKVGHFGAFLSWCRFRILIRDQNLLLYVCFKLWRLACSSR